MFFVTLLLATTRICYPFSLYKLLSLTPITIVVYEIDPLELINAFPFWIAPSNPLLSINETENKFLLIYGTHSKFVTLNVPPESIQNDTIPDPFTTCLVPIPSSTCIFESDSVKLSNTSHDPIILHVVPLYINHARAAELIHLSLCQ